MNKNRKAVPHCFFAMQKSDAGFTALYAVLVASLALAIGLAVANIALKESLLSSTARESQFAFYAADSGIECARFWDKQQAFEGAVAASISCNDAPRDITIQGGMSDCSIGCTFRIAYSPSPESECVDVTVTKDTSGGTTITADGYNTCNETDPRRVNRRLILNIQVF